MNPRNQIDPSHTRSTFAITYVMEAKQFYLCTFTNMERGTAEHETTIVQGTDKSDAGHRAIRKMRKAIGAERARYYDLWSTKLIATTF